MKNEADIRIYFNVTASSQENTSSYSYSLNYPDKVQIITVHPQMPSIGYYSSYNVIILYHNQFTRYHKNAHLAYLYFFKN